MIPILNQGNTFFICNLRNIFFKKKTSCKMKVSLNGSCLGHSECQPKYVQTANHYARHDLTSLGSLLFYNVIHLAIIN